ncbi:MAG TPA: hypothetical protein VHS52_05615 [Acidimicrobiales bacterium]|nr:hypothetical protein [Acidimicrobiales bacterium]
MDPNLSDVPVDDPDHDDRPSPVDETAGLTEGLRAQARRVERLLGSGVQALGDVEGRVLPAWRQVTRGEPRWPVSMVVVGALLLQTSLPAHLAFHPRWLLPSLEGLLLVGLVVADPRRIERRSAGLRVTSMVLIALISAANAWSAGRLVLGLVHGTEHATASRLLMSGGAIWLTNVIVFALWYWELDRGGPVARAMAMQPYPDFLFAQMQSPELAPPQWEPAFVDYLYLSFTNATAFSPTDVLPMSRWAKCTMMLQSAVSLATVVLVIARAVNILQSP